MRRAGLWRAAGMGGQRLDRAELRHRLPDVEGWIVDELADAFEPAMLAGLKTAADRKKPASEREPKRRTRQGRSAETGDET